MEVEYEDRGSCHCLSQRQRGREPASSHAFLDEFTLAYHRTVADSLRTEPAAVLGHVRRNLVR
jgi:hypothetical protein